MTEGAPIIIKKKKGHGHGHHGGAWKVAYADFVTAMMAFFLVMWIMGMSSDDRMAIQGYFQDPMGFGKSPPKGKLNLLYPGSVKKNSLQVNAGSQPDQIRSKDRREVDDTKEATEKAIAAGVADLDLRELAKHIEIRITDEGLEIEFVEGQGVAFFALGSSTVTPQAKKLITDIGAVLAKSGRVMKIHGHTDARPYSGNAFDNYDLSANRANAVRRVMREAGVRPAQILEVAGKADQALKYPDKPLDDANRRVTLVIPFMGKKDGEGNAPLKAPSASDYVSPVGIPRATPPTASNSDSHTPAKGHDSGH